jgi:hypothetical protein
MDISGADAFGNFVEGIGPGITDKVIKYAPKYLLDQYGAAVRRLSEFVDKYPDASVVDSLPAAEKLEVQTAMENYAELSRSLIDVLKVVIALEVVLKGKVQ